MGRRHDRRSGEGLGGTVEKRGNAAVIALRLEPDGIRPILPIVCNHVCSMSARGLVTDYRRFAFIVFSICFELFMLFKAVQAFFTICQDVHKEDLLLWWNHSSS